MGSVAASSSSVDSSSDCAWTSLLLLALVAHTGARVGIPGLTEVGPERDLQAKFQLGKGWDWPRDGSSALNAQALSVHGVSGICGSLLQVISFQ